MQAGQPCTQASDCYPDVDETFCQQNAGTAFSCRSTGGGSKNRKICSP